MEGRREKDTVGADTCMVLRSAGCVGGDVERIRGVVSAAGDENMAARFLRLKSYSHVPSMYTSCSEHGILDVQRARA